MEDIPIAFEYQGKKFIASFRKVGSSGSTALWHLMDEDHYYLGWLRHSEFTESWVFDESKPEDKLSELTDYFGQVITGLYQ